MSRAERDFDRPQSRGYEAWVAEQLFGKRGVRRDDANAWMAACLVALLKPDLKIKKDAPDKVKDAGKEEAEGWRVREADREALKKTMRRSIIAINLFIDAQTAEAKAKKKPLDGIEEKISLADVEKEWAEGKFGPKSVEAYKRVAKFLQVGTLKHLKILDRYGLDIPPGCPVEPPLDKSGRHIGDELFRAKLQKDEIKWEILRRQPEEGKLPDAEDILRLCKADAWIVEAQSGLKSAFIRWQAGKLLAELKTFEDPKKPETHLTDWYPPKRLMDRDPKETAEQRRKNDLELEKWIAATTQALEPAEKLRNYAQTIALLNYMSKRRTESDFERWVSDLPTVRKLIAKWGYGIKGDDLVFPDDALKPENFPGVCERDPKTGLVTFVRPFFPPHPEKSREHRHEIGKINKWLATYGPDLDQVQLELARLIAGGAVYPEGHAKAGQPIINTDQLIMVHEDDYPEKTDSEDRKIRYPAWQKDGSGKDIGGQEVPEFNFCKHGVDVQRDGEYYVIRPYKQYYYARFYSYNHWNVGGDWNVPFTNFNVGAMQKAGEKIYTRKEPLRIKGHQFALCFENGRLEFVRGEQVEAWAKAAETNDDVGKYVALTVDLALLATAAYEFKGAQIIAKEGAEILIKQAAKEGVVLAESVAKQAALRAYRMQLAKAGWHAVLAGTGFGRQALENWFGAGKTFQEIRHWAILADMTFNAFAPEGLMKQIGEVTHGTQGLRVLELVESRLEAAWKTSSAPLAERLLSGTEHVLSGKALADIPFLQGTKDWILPFRVPFTLKHGVMPYADYYYLYEISMKTGQPLVDAIRGEDPLQIKNAKEALRLRGAEANYDQRSPFKYTITPAQIKASAERVLTEYGRSLVLAGFDHDADSYKLEKKVKEAKDQDAGKKKVCVDRCLRVFADPESRAQKRVAAAGLLELCAAEGDAGKQILGEVTVKGKKIQITRKQILDFVEGSAETLEKQTVEALRLPEDDAKRTAHKNKLMQVFLASATGPEKTAAAAGLFRLCGKEGKLEGKLGEVEIPLPSGKKLKVDLTGEEVSRYLAITPEGLMREGRATLFSPDDDARKKAHVSDAVYAFRNGDTEAKVAAAIALLGNRKEMDPAEVLGETTTYTVQLRYRNGEGRHTVKTIKFADKAAADKYEKEQKDKYKDDDNMLVTSSAEKGKVTAKDALEFLKLQAETSDNGRLRLVVGDYLCRLSHLAEDGFAIMLKQFQDAKEKLSKDPENAELKKDATKKEALLEAAGKFADLTRYDYTDMVGSCLEVIASNHAPRDLKGEAMVGKIGPRLDFLLEYFKHRVEPGLDQLKGTIRNEVLASLYKRDSKTIEAALERIANDKTQDPDVRALAVSILSANQATRATVNGKPVSFGTSVDVGSKSSKNVYIEAKGEGVAARHATIKVNEDGRVFVRAIGANEVWIKRPGEKEPTFIKVAGDFVEIKSEDQVVLGDKTKGAVLKFGSEREELISRIHREWSQKEATPGQYAALVRDRLRAEVGVDADAFSPLGGHDDIKLSKFRAALALDSLREISGYRSDGDRTIAVNKALIECFDLSNPQLAKAVLEKLVEPVSIDGAIAKPRLETLTNPQLARLRVLCTAALTMRGLNGAINDEMREKIDLKIAIVEKLPEIFKGADVGQVAQVVHRLQCFISPDMKDESNPYPRYASSLREAAIDALAKMSPETARLLLPDVVRKDLVETVRLKALEWLVEIGHPQLRELCIERLTDETDPLILKRLRRVEYFERRPDRSSAWYKKEFDRASAAILAASNRSLAGYEKMYDKRAGIDFLTPWSREKEIISKRNSQFFVKNHRHMTYAEQAALAKELELKNYPYNEDFIKACVYKVVSNGEAAGTEWLARNNMCQDGAVLLREVCYMLVEGKDPRAKDMVWALKQCTLQGAIHPRNRHYVLDGLDALVESGAMSKEDYAVTVATMLQRDLKRLPKDKKKDDDADQYFSFSESLHRRAIASLKRYKTPTVTPILEAIIDDDSYPFARVKADARALYAEMRERTGYFKDVYQADGKASEADLAKPLKQVLGRRNVDAETVCQALCLAFNGRPIKKADDPRRGLAYVAAGDSHPKVRVLAAEFLLLSDVKEDRERGAEVLAAILVRRPTEGTFNDAKAIADDVKANPKKYKEGDGALLEKTIAEVRRQELAKALANVGQVGPFGQLAPLATALDRPSTRPDYSRDLDYQADYESALVEIKRGWESKIPRHYQEFKLESHGYRLLNPYLFREDWGQAIRDRYGATWERRAERIFAGKETIKDEEAKAGQVVVDNMWTKYDELCKKAREDDGDYERTFLQFVIRRKACTFWESHQPEAMKRAADAIYDICKLKAPGAGDFEGLLASVLIDDPTLSPYVRKRLIEAYLELVEPNGKISQERGAITLAAILRTEYESTPAADKPGHKESVERQLLILKKLHDWRNRMVSPVLEAIAKNHAVASIKEKAAEMLKEFATKDVDDVLNMRRTLGGATLLADDPRLSPLVAAMNDGKRNLDQRFAAASAILTHGADDVKEKHKLAALLVVSDAADKSENSRIQFEAGRLMLSMPPGDHKFPRISGARALARVAITGTPGHALESQTILKGLNQEERGIAVRELISIIDKTSDKATKANAATLMLQLSSGMIDYYNSKALSTLVDLAVTGDDVLRARLKGTLESLSPKHALLAADCAIRWVDDHRTGNKDQIADALRLSAAFAVRADSEAKSPAKLFKAAEKAVQLLGADHEVTKELSDLVSGVNPDSQLKPIKDADIMDIVTIFGALRSANEETRLGAALTLVNSENSGVSDLYRFFAIERLADLSQNGKAAAVRKAAGDRLKAILDELDGPIESNRDSRLHWMYTDYPVLRLAAAKAVLFEDDSVVTADQKEAAIRALSDVAIKGDVASKKEAEGLLLKLRGDQLDAAVSWLGTLAFVAGRGERPDKAKVLACWNLAERLYKNAGIDPTSEKFLEVTYGKLVAQGTARPAELQALEAQISDRRNERSKDPTTRFSANTLDRYLKEYDDAVKKHGAGSIEVARAQLAISKVAFWESCENENRTVRGNTGRMAEYHAKGAVDILRKRVPADSPELCDALYRLGIAQFEQGKFDDAEKHLKEALEIYKKQAGKMPVEDGIWIASRLARVYLIKENYDEAEKINKELVTFANRRFDYLENERVIRALTDVVRLYPADLELDEKQRAQRAKEAEPLLKRILELSKSGRGEAHDETISLVVMLAKNLAEQKRDKEAIGYYEQAIRYYRAQPKCNKRELALLVSSYGCSLFRLDRKGDADKAFEQARQLRIEEETERIYFRQDRFKRLLGDGDPTRLTKEQVDNLHKAIDVGFDKIKDLEKKHGANSEQVARERLAISEKFLKLSLNTDHPTVLENCTRAAILHANNSLKVLQDKLGKEHPDVAKAHYQLAMAQLWGGLSSDALTNLKEAMKICQKHPDKVNSGDAVWIASRLVLANIVEGKLGDMDSALTVLTDLAKKKPVKSNMGDVGRALDQVVVAISNPRNTAQNPRIRQADELLQLALEISVAHNDADSLPTARLRLRSASILAGKGEHAKAVGIYEKAIGVIEKQRDFSREELADILQLYCNSLQQLKRTAEAEKVVARIRDLRK